MARDKVYSTSDSLEVVHHMPLGKYNSRISIDEPIMSNELLPNPVKDEYIYMGIAKG